MRTFAVWLTGLPASGKSTIAAHLQKILRKTFNLAVDVLESDDFRRNVHPYLLYNESDRNLFYCSLVYVVGILLKNNVIVIVAATASRRKYREMARARLKNFVEVYVKCPLRICMARDRKGLYEAARRGEKPTFPILIPEKDDPLGEYVKDRELVARLFPSCGVYEIPENPECVVDSDEKTPKENAEIILSFLKNYCCLPTSTHAKPRVLRVMKSGKSRN